MLDNVLIGDGLPCRSRSCRKNEFHVVHLGINTTLPHLADRALMNKPLYFSVLKEDKRKFNANQWQTVSAYPCMKADIARSRTHKTDFPLASQLGPNVANPLLG